MRISIIGGHGHYGFALDGLEELSGHTLVAVAPGSVGEDMTHVVSKACRHGAPPREYEDYRDMLDREQPDVVVVNPEYHLQAAACLAALERDVHVYAEKPLALNEEDLSAVAAALRSSRGRLGIMFNYRYDGRFQRARRIVRDGLIGRPCICYAQKSYKMGARPAFYNSREKCGGIIPWVGIHAIDWTRWVSGLEYVAVTAIGIKLPQSPFPGMEDAAACLFEMEGGVPAMLSFDYLRPPGAASHGDDRLRLAGSEGCLEINGEGLHLIDARGSRRLEPLLPEHSPFVDFLLSLTDERHQPQVRAEDALTAAGIALAARRSADAGSRIDLSPPDL